MNADVFLDKLLDEIKLSMKDFGGGHFLVRSGVLRGTTPYGIVLIAV